MPQYCHFPGCLDPGESDSVGLSATAMPTLLVQPPEMCLRMEFMDAGVEYERIPDGYVIFLRDSQTAEWDEIRARFSIPNPEENPPLFP